MTQSEYSIEARNLTKFYGATAAIKDVSFTVRPGEVVGFLGPNGAGKSTTLKILSGQLMADRGEAWLDGISVARHPSRVKKHLGFMPENNPLPEDLRVIEYLRYRGRLKGLKGRDLRDRVEQSLEACDLQRTARRKLIGSLSKGFRQRVGLADAILNRPAVTILDEPTIGLDPHQVLQIRRLIDGLKGRTTVILSSHILAEVEISCDRVVIINQGLIVAAGTSQELRREFFPGRCYELVAAGDDTAVKSAVSELGLEAKLSPSEGVGDLDPAARAYRIVTTREEDLSEVIVARLSRLENLRLQAFRLNRPTLEDIFLAATRRSWDVETADLTTAARGLTSTDAPIP